MRKRGWAKAHLMCQKEAGPCDLVAQAIQEQKSLVPQPEKPKVQLFYAWRRDTYGAMSGDFLPLAVSLSQVGTRSREVTVLYSELRKPLLRYLVCLGLSRDEAQDVVQDAFVALQRHVTSGGSQENIRSWVFRVAHNRARNRQSSYDRRFSESFDAELHTASDSATPEQLVLEKEKFRRLAKALHSLTKDERACLSLRAAGLRYREIGEVLGVPTSTVADTVDRIIRKLAGKCNV
jgi:RNA polymerase sigma-70 factor, ECF subfamily